MVALCSILSRENLELEKVLLLTYSFAVSEIWRFFGPCLTVCDVIFVRKQCSAVRVKLFCQPCYKAPAYMTLYSEPLLLWQYLSWWAIANDSAFINLHPHSIVTTIIIHCYLYFQLLQSLQQLASFSILWSSSGDLGLLPSLLGLMWFKFL